MNNCNRSIGIVNSNMVKIQVRQARTEPTSFSAIIFPNRIFKLDPKKSNKHTSFNS